MDKTTTHFIHIGVPQTKYCAHTFLSRLSAFSSFAPISPIIVSLHMTSGTEHSNIPDTRIGQRDYDDAHFRVHNTILFTTFVINLSDVLSALQVKNIQRRIFTIIFFSAGNIPNILT